MPRDRMDDFSDALAPFHRAVAPVVGYGGRRHTRVAPWLHQIGARFPAGSTGHLRHLAEPTRRRLRTAFFHEIEYGIKRAMYHFDRVAGFDGAVKELAEVHGVREVCARFQGGVGGGDTSGVDFEYQAFVVSLRSALDYLAGGASGYFGRDVDSYNVIADRIDRANPPWHPSGVATAVAEVFRRSKQDLTPFWSDSERRTRDRISHRQPVGAGVLNMNERGVFFAGGGEDLGPEEPLVAALTKYLERAEVLVEETCAILLEDILTGEGVDPAPQLKATRWKAESVDRDPEVKWENERRARRGY